MRILHLTTYASLGGAAKAAQRIHQGLLAVGVESRIYCQFPDQFQTLGRLELFSARARRRLDQLPLKLYPKRQPLPFSTAIVPRDLNDLEHGWQPDIVHAHWINHGLTSVESLGRLKAPLIWTFHDSWPFTGGCHIPLDCVRYRGTCGACPELVSSSETDISFQTLRRKKRAWQHLNFTAVCPSQWLAAAARSSSLMQKKEISVIPNPVDLNIFRPAQDHSFRRRFNIAADKKIILAGAMDNTRDLNKGFHLFVRALRELKKGGGAGEMHLVTFGGDEEHEATLEGFNATHLGTVNDEREMAKIFGAADVFVCPSLLENLPYTVIESLACGTPVVAFSTGGIPDLISHQNNGYLAKPFSPASLALGINWILSTANTEPRRNARDFAVGKLSFDSITERYLNIYNRLLK